MNSSPRPKPSRNSAVSVAQRRQKAADEAEGPESQLHLLRIALETAQTGPASRDRMELAFFIANEAYGENDYALASRAIDQALIDAQRIIPTKKRQLGALEIYRARIALAQGDLDLAEVAATSANQIFAEVEADPSNRGIAEAVLAEILGKKGETDRALIIARSAHARIGNEETLDDHAQRQILASLARVERSAGNLESAQQHLEQALAIPTADFEPDRDLVEQLKIERQEFGDSDARPPSTRVLDAPQPPSAGFRRDPALGPGLRLDADSIATGRLEFSKKTGAPARQNTPRRCPRRDRLRHAAGHDRYVCGVGAEQDR